MDSKYVHCNPVQNRARTGSHSGIYGHKNKTQIFEIVAFVLQFYTHFNTYDMN